jgi:UDP-N-acetylmuramyl tripeptide synthase
VRLLLAKNPTGLNEVLRALADEPHPHLLFLLNDQPADGEDVSWIWDAGFESVASLDPAYVATGGRRAYDLALRLKYTGVLPVNREPSIERALDHALEATPPGSALYVIPTYTALLEVRGVLERRGFTAPYWEHSHA